MPVSDRTPARRLRELLEAPGIIRSLGAHDVFTGLVVQETGFETVFLGGFGTSASLLGMPDLNLLTMTEMAGAVARMASRLSIPVIADGDTGHGDLPNVARTVREFERAGAAGILLEDQVAPKRCGHFEGKQVVPAEEMLLRLRAALEARQDPDFVIIARTDARQVNGLEDAIERMRAYIAAGADVGFVEAPYSAEEMRTIAREIRAPLLANLLVGGHTPTLSIDEVARMGYRIAVYPVESLMVTAAALRRLARALAQDGHLGSLRGEMLSFSELKELLGLEEMLSLRDCLAGG